MVGTPDAYASPLINDRSAALSTASAEVLPVNKRRRYLLIQNVGAVNVGVNILGGTAAIGTAGTVTLAPLGSLVFEQPGFVPTCGFSAIAASGTPGLTIWEG